MQMERYRRMVVNGNGFLIEEVLKLNCDISKQIIFLRRFLQDLCHEHLLCASRILGARRASMNTDPFLPSKIFKPNWRETGSYVNNDKTCHKCCVENVAPAEFWVNYTRNLKVEEGLVEERPVSWALKINNAGQGDEGKGTGSHVCVATWSCDGPEGMCKWGRQLWVSLKWDLHHPVLSGGNGRVSSMFDSKRDKVPLQIELETS